MTTTRQLVSRRIEERLEPLDDFTLPAVAAEIAAEIAADDALKAAYVDETLYHMVYQEAVQLLSSQRMRYLQIRIAGAAAAAAMDPQSPSGIRPLSQRGNSKRNFNWLRHTEYIGDKHIRIMAMTREQIPMAIFSRAKRRDAENVMIKVLENLEQDMVPGQQVGDRYSAARIETIYQCIKLGLPIPPESKAV